jgi:hypothetical protein
MIPSLNHRFTKIVSKIFHLHEDCYEGGISYQISLAEVEKDGSVLRFVPISDRTPEFCLAAVRCAGWHIQFVPDELRTPELCLVAVTSDNRSLQFVPKELLSRDRKSVLKKEELLKKYSREELLTSNNFYLRELGRDDNNWN